EAAVIRGNRIAKRLGSPRNRVLVYIRLNRTLRRCFNLRRRGEIGKALRQVNGSVLQRKPRHLTDDRFLKFSDAGALKTAACRSSRHVAILVCRLYFAAGSDQGGTMPFTRA